MQKSRFYPPLLQVALALTTLLLCGCGPDEARPQAASETKMDIDTLLQQGEELYGQSCIICHFGGDGGGLNPSLITSATVKGPAEGLIKVILKGQSGISVVNGKKLNGIMPPQASMNDVEIAAVATYVRREFGKVEAPVQPSDVAKVRAQP